jgi:lipopolysaccharide/colanic/teichoic acid biosynthesis glycosyltransferase
MRAFSRLAPFDCFWAGISPILAFLIRDGGINRIDGVAIYCAIALAVSLISFQWFKISSPISEFFSFHDAFTVVKACLTTVALTAVVLFVFTRLEDAPRSVPVIHFLVLGGGLIAVRAIARLTHLRRAHQPANETLENILMVGATRPAWFFSKMVEELAPYERRIIAILDERPSLRYRTLNGYSIVGSPANLSRIVDEYAVHGVKIGKVIIATHPKDLTGASWIDLSEACKARDIPIEWLHEKFSFPQGSASNSVETAIGDGGVPVNLTSRFYWRAKRLLDVILAIAMMVVLAPLTILVAVLVWIDVGVPIVFWQQRIGQFGRPLHIYKFRTMRASIDESGRNVPDSERSSTLGSLLRRTRMDEIPQLLNILQGNMSLIGPRPLLPADQPKRVRYRLQVRPGISGLAQINGGTLLSPEEKDALDEWYVQHANLLLDFEILLRTVLMIVRGERRNERAIARAVYEQRPSWP